MMDLLNVAPCGIFSFNDEGIIMQANENICAKVQISKEDLLGQKLNTIFTLPTLIFYQTHFYPLLKMQHSVDEIFVTLKSKEGKEIPVLLSAKRIEAERGVEYVCACLPIYNRKNYEDEIIEAKRLAEKALEKNSALTDAKAKLQLQIELLDEKMYELQGRNEELKELSMTISHDLQESVRKLHLFTDLLLNADSKFPQEQTLKRITKQTLRLKQLLLGIEDWMTLDNNVLKVEELVLSEVLLEAKQKLLAKYPDQPFELEIGNLPKIRGDREQFLILFYEFLSNSLKFRSAERPLKVRITTTILQHNQFKALHDRYLYNDHYRIVYSDNGIGFNEKYTDQVLHLFKKLDKNSRGMGVGLTLCKKIVANHKGKFTVTGKEGEGCSFIIFLPLNS